MNIFGIFAVPLSYLLKWIYDIVGNYGITLIIITAFIKLILYPVYKKQIMSTAGMSDVQPKIRDIQNRYANDPAKMREKMDDLYKEYNISPTSGCLPMVVQMFVIMGLFALFRSPLSYLDSDKMVFAIHEGFLWIKDLAQPDPWILPLLCGVATFLSFYMSSANGAMPGGNNNAMMLIMKYGFPIMLVWLTKTYPAALGLYWFISNFLQIFYNLHFNRLRKKLAEKKREEKRNKRKPVRAGQGVR